VLAAGTEGEGAKGSRLNRERFTLSTELLAEPSGEVPIVVVDSKALMLPELAPGDRVALVACMFPTRDAEAAKAVRVEELCIGSTRHTLAPPYPVDELAQWLGLPATVRRAITPALPEEWKGQLLFDPDGGRAVPFELVAVADRMLRLRLSFTFEVVEVRR
jgi:hypothetical protein